MLTDGKSNDRDDNALNRAVKNLKRDIKGKISLKLFDIGFSIVVVVVVTIFLVSRQLTLRHVFHSC